MLFCFFPVYLFAVPSFSEQISHQLCKIDGSDLIFELYCVIFLCPRRNFGWHIKIELSVRPSVTNRVSAISHKLLKHI